MTGPRQSIPEFPPNEEYGEHRVGTDAAERQSWASISRRIGESDLYWLATTRPDGRPHAVPIGGSWHEDHLFFNLTSAYYATRAALPQMVKQNYGRVIHIGSGYAKMGGGPLAYSAGKHGLIGMMKAMVYQIPPAITVNVLCPGWTDTKLANDYFEGAAATLGTTSQALRAQAESENVQKRIVKPDELGPMAALLASEEGSAITGQVISVDGGYKV